MSSWRFLRVPRSPWKKNKNFQTLANIYAQNLILVNLILVNFGGFLVIARNPPDGF